MENLNLTYNVFEQQIQRLIHLRYKADKKRYYYKYIGRLDIANEYRDKINDYTEQIEKLYEIV